MSLEDRNWTAFMLDAEHDHHGYRRMVSVHNALRARIGELEADVSGLKQKMALQWDAACSVRDERDSLQARIAELEAERNAGCCDHGCLLKAAGFASAKGMGTNSGKCYCPDWKKQAAFLRLLARLSAAEKVCEAAENLLTGTLGKQIVRWNELEKALAAYREWTK